MLVICMALMALPSIAGKKEAAKDYVVLASTAVRDDAAEVTGQSVVKGQEVHAGHESPSREKTPPATAATTSPSAAGKGMTARAKDAPSAQTSSADTSEKRKPVTSAAASRPAAGTASGAARAEKPAAVNDAAPAPGTDSPWNFDLNLRGYVGERQGGSFNVQATYTF